MMWSQLIPIVLSVYHFIKYDHILSQQTICVCVYGGFRTHAHACVYDLITLIIVLRIYFCNHFETIDENNERFGVRGRDNHWGRCFEALERRRDYQQRIVG